jgi:hypothetical protein
MVSSPLVTAVGLADHEPKWMTYRQLEEVTAGFFGVHPSPSFEVVGGRGQVSLFS